MSVPTVTRVACYARVSTEDQADRQTFDAQKKFLRRYCELHGLTDGDCSRTPKPARLASSWSTAWIGSAARSSRSWPDTTGWIRPTPRSDRAPSRSIQRVRSASSSSRS